MNTDRLTFNIDFHRLLVTFPNLVVSLADVGTAVGSRHRVELQSLGVMVLLAIVVLSPIHSVKRMTFLCRCWGKAGVKQGLTWPVDWIQTNM